MYLPGTEYKYSNPIRSSAGAPNSAGILGLLISARLATPDYSPCFVECSTVKHRYDEQSIVVAPTVRRYAVTLACHCLDSHAQCIREKSRHQH